ncbi:MAG: NAD(P)/FAD-dependent oxidoreductase [Acidobacteria bacterium]|nr:MAG: NAD(P)/FAD-dependent oxidoreductase [Acidobacteriota bacterium]
MERQFDLIVIGTGAAGSPVAYRCRQAGWSVAIIDSHPFGGTCSLRGCDPKKVLVGAADVIDWTRRMQSKGVVAPNAGIDWPALMRFKRSFTDPVPGNREKGYRDAGIATFHGRARFLSGTQLQVGGDVLSGRFVHIAAGARPATLGIDGEIHLTTSDQFLDLDALPKRISFVGGGYISFEFAHVAARAGVQVRVIHRGPRPLEEFDSDLVDNLVKATRKAGIDVHLNAAVKSIEQRNTGFVLKVSTDGAEDTFESDMVVHGAGRVPDIDDLDLEKAVVKREKNGVSVNEYLQSISNSAVYAAGDAAASGGFPLTPVGSMEAQVVADNILEGNHRKANYLGVPTVVFTVPPLAAVGLRVEDAKKQGLKFKTNYADTSEWYSSRRLNLKHSAFKVLVEENSGHILGAHLLGAEAEETINLFALAIRLGLKADDLREMVYSYPTHSSDVTHMLN